MQHLAAAMDAPWAFARNISGILFIVMVPIIEFTSVGWGYRLAIPLLMPLNFVTAP